MKAWLRDTRSIVYGVSLVFSLAVFLWWNVFAHSDRLMIIRLTQTYAFTAVAYLYVTLLITPLTQLFPEWPYKSLLIYSRRALGISTCYFSILHAAIAFFGQLGGFPGLPFLSLAYLVPVCIGLLALLILVIMAAISNSWAIRRLGGKIWKYIHRLVYLCGFLILLHFLLIGTHFKQLNLLSGVIFLLIGTLLVLELYRFQGYLENRYTLSNALTKSILIVGLVAFLVLIYWLRFFHV